MSARDLLRVGFIVLGAFLIVSALTSLVESLNQRPAFMASGDQPIPGILQSVVFLAGASFVVSLVFGVLPGVLLIRRSERWSQRVLPNVSASSSLSVSALFSVALMVVGVVFGIRGVAGVVGGVVAVVAQLSVEREAYAWGLAWQSLSSALVHLVAGVSLFSWGRQSALNAA
jgi:hypothetical protein